MDEVDKNFPTFEMLFELEEIQEIQDSFSTTAGVASIIADPLGNPITRPSNFCRLCKDIIRITDTGLANCMKSDATIGQCSTEGPIVQKCLSGGLWDAGVSMIVSGHHIATWLIGQVRDVKIDEAAMRAYARKIGVNEITFLEALREVPVLPLSQFKQIGNTLYLIANQLSAQAYQKFLQARIIAEKKKTERTLLRQNAYLEALHETSLGMLNRRKLADVLTSIIKRAARLTSIPNSFVYLYDADTDGFGVAAACGSSACTTGDILSQTEGFCRRVWETGAVMVINEDNTVFGKNEEHFFPCGCSAVGVPLTSGKRVEGGMVFYRQNPGERISPETVHILGQFAELASVAADNNQLFEALNKELEQRIRLENEHEQMARMLRQSQKLEAIGTLAGGIAHDFNNILFPVMGYSEMLLNEIPEDDPMHDKVRTILDGAYRARDLVNQILTFSRQAEQKFRPLKIQLILKEVIKFARASLPSTIKIEEDISRQAPEVTADPTMIHQLGMNLITNALHAMEADGGTLTVRLYETYVTPGSEPLPDMMSGPYICLEVSDTGCGMDGETKQRMFEPYFTSKPKGKGTGLGLSVVHGVIQNLGGGIRVVSQKDAGSSFLVYLPVADKVVLREKPARIEDAKFQGDERIMIVDDEAPVLNMLAQMLEKNGYTVFSENSSTDALERFQHCPGDFDLLITDMTMPEMTGDELIRRVKTIRPGIPVILMTGFSERVAGQRACGSKPDKILMKPIGKNDLIASIRFLLDKDAFEKINR